jgi:hypothetical protein
MTIDLAGKIAAAAHELLASADRLLERKIFEAVKRIVMYERPHRPILGDDLSGKANHAAQLHPFGLDVGRPI